MQAMAGGPTTPIEQITELGEPIFEKLIAAGITTVEALADMTPEQFEEIPGIGEKTLEKISVAVRHYFGHYEEGEERPAIAAPAAPKNASETEGPEEDTMTKDTGSVLAEAAQIQAARKRWTPFPRNRLPRPEDASQRCVQRR